MKRLLLSFLLVFLLCTPGLCADKGSVSSTTSCYGGSVIESCVTTITWVGDASDGTVTSQIVLAAASGTPGVKPAYSGQFIQLLENVITAGSTPTAATGFTLTDANGTDITGGMLVNCEAYFRTKPKSDTVNATYGPVMIVPPITFNLTGNSVHSATGKLIIYSSKVP